MQPARILESCLYVDDLDSAEECYHRLFALELHSKVPGRHVFFQCGRGMVLLFTPVMS